KAPDCHHPYVGRTGHAAPVLAIPAPPDASSQRQRGGPPDRPMSGARGGRVTFVSASFSGSLQAQGQVDMITGHGGASASGSAFGSRRVGLRRDLVRGRTVDVPTPGGT